MDASAPAIETNPTPEAAVDAEEDPNDGLDDVAGEPAVDLTIHQDPETEHTDSLPIAPETATGDGQEVVSTFDEPGSSNATTGKPASTNPAPLPMMPQVLTDATVSPSMAAQPIVQTADQTVAPVAAAASIAELPQDGEVVRAQPRSLIDAEPSRATSSDSDADRAADVEQTVSRFRASRPVAGRAAGSDQSSSERQPASAETTRSAPSPSPPAARDGDVELAADAVEAKPVAGVKNHATREARSLQLHVAASVDAPRGGEAPATPATSRAALVEQAIRLENALASGTPTGDVATTRSSTAVSATHAPSIGAGTNEAALLSARTVVADEADVPASFSSQAIRGLTAMVNQRGGSMMLRLDPPELGMLRVQMTIVGGNVTAEFTAAAQQTQTLLDRSMAALRQSLEHQGLTVERLTVHPATAASPSSQSSMRQDDGGGGGPNQQQSWANQHDAGGSESRGRRDQSPDQSNAWNRLVARAMSFESLLGADDRLVAVGTGADS